MVENNPSRRVDSKEDNRLTVTKLSTPEICYARGGAYSSRMLLAIGELPFVAVSYKVNGPLSTHPWGPYRPLKPTDFHPPYGLPRISIDEKRNILKKLGVPTNKAKSDEEVASLFRSHIDSRADDYDVVFQRFSSEPSLRESYNTIVNEACLSVEQVNKENLATQGEV